MQNRGAIKFFAIAFALVCLFQLSFTYFTRGVEKDAVEYANSDRMKKLAKEIAKGNAIRETIVADSISKKWKEAYLDSIANEEIYN